MTDKEDRTFSPIKWLLRYIRLLFVVGVLGFGCALLTGWVIGRSLVTQVEEWGNRQSDYSVTPPPMRDALNDVTSLRMTFRAETTSNIVLLTGDAIFVQPMGRDFPPDFYLHWKLVEPPDEQELMLFDGRLLSRQNSAQWTQNTAFAGDIIDLLMEQFLTDSSGIGGFILPLLGINFGENMLGWDETETTVVDGHPVQTYVRDDIGILAWQVVMPQYAEIFHSASAELSIGTDDNLPHQLRYRLNLGETSAQPYDALVFTLTFTNFNDPITLSDPFAGS